MLTTILISLFIGFVAAIALGVCLASINVGLRKGREIRRELAEMDTVQVNQPYTPVQSRGLWAVS